MENRAEKVKKFEEACRKAGFEEKGRFVFEKNQNFPKTLTLSTLIHGNEIGGIDVFLELLDDLPKLPCNLRLLLGNVDAYLADKRFLESDLNRSFDVPDTATLEQRRAKEIEPFLRATNFLIDIHQTIEPTASPFFIFPYEEKSFNYARALNPTLPIITYKAEVRVGTSVSSFATKNGATAVTLETGQKGQDPAQRKLAREILEKAFKLLDGVPVSSQWHKVYTWGQTVQNYDFSLELVKTLTNFAPIAKGELLAKSAEKEVFSDITGVALFPKYGINQKTSKELVQIIRPVKDQNDL